MLCFLCAGCSSEKESPIPETPKIELPSGTDTKPVVSQQGGTSSVTFTATAEWTASAVTRAVDWLSVSPTHGSAGTVNLQITLQPNDTYDERNAAILLTCGTTTQTITVTQKQKDALLVSSNKVEIEAQESSFTLEWQANVPVSYTIEESAKGWLTPSSSTRGLTTSSMKFQAAENQNTESRQAVITLQGNGLTEQVKVYQAGSKPSIVLSQKDYAVSAEGGEIQVELKSNVAYKVVMPEVSWITESSTRATSTYTHLFTVAANEGYDARSAEIAFVNEENGLREKVTVTQAQKDAIVVAQEQYTVQATGGQLQISVQANVAFDVSINVDWMRKAAETRGLTDRALTFAIDENKAKTSREAKITLKAGQLSQEIKVLQEGKTQTDGGIDDIPVEPW